MKVVYEVNGKIFNTKLEAEEYEENLLAKDKRQKELDAARDKYFKLLKEFNEDFSDDEKECEISYISDFTDWINELFGV